MTLGRRIFHRSKMALEFCCVVEDEITSWADGARRNVDNGTVKPTNISHASVVPFCCCHVFGCCLYAGMSRSAPEALICDRQAWHPLWFSMRSSLCVTLSCRRPTLTTFPSILIKQRANVVFSLSFQIVVPFIITELDSTRCHCLREESRSKLSQIQREKPFVQFETQTEDVTKLELNSGTKASVYRSASNRFA